MKKIYSFLCAALLLLGFTACEDVPAPYGLNDEIDSTKIITPKGTGTADDPYNIAMLLKLFSDGNIPTNEIYFKGIVSSIKEIGNSFGNATYYVSDNGSSSKTFYVYRSKYLNNQNFTSSDQLHVGDTVIVCGLVTSYNGTPETEQNSSYLYWVSSGSGPIGPIAEPSGNGTADDPYNIAKLLKLFNDGNIPTDEIYFKGIVSSIKELDTGSFGNATYYVSDDGSQNNTFYVYRSKYLNNQKFTSADQLQVGDTVVVCGKVTSYMGNTPETEQNASYLYSISKGNGGPTPGPIEGGTADNPLTVAQLQALFDANSIPSAKIYVKGIVSEIQEISTSYGNATYFISDDGTTAGQFEVYRGYALDGNKFTAEDQLQVGDEVIVYGQVVLYNKTREFTTGSQLYYSSRLGQGGGDTPTPPGPTPDPVNLDDFQNGDFETWESGLPTHWKSISTASSATLSQSADAHGGNYSVCVEGTTSANKRLAYEEMTLAAGTYIVKFFVKAESAAASVCPGYVPVVDGKVGSYAYGDYVNDIPSDTWTEVTHQFTLTATTTVNLVVMNSKKYGANVLIDDFTISTVPSAKKRK